ncbi:MAG TPA: AAA family ATPase [Rectinemataceae bacterium]|nr:AAA family ATPase [Rectinemataceae bacterium]
MKVSRLKLQNFRGIKEAELDFDGHTLLIGANNVGKSTICEALDLALGSDRQNRFPVVDEFDFYNARYLDETEKPVEIRIEVLLTEVTPTLERACGNYLERWDPATRRILTQGEIDKVDGAGLVWCLRLLSLARYNPEEDEFESTTHYATIYDPDNEDNSRVPRATKRTFGFLYLRALRTGSRALSLERGSLLDIILRIQSLQTGIWEHVRQRLETLDPPIDADTTNLTPVLQNIEARLAEYISIAKPGEATRLFVSQLTREHLRKTLSFFISVTEDQKPIPFQNVGTGTINTLVLALLSFLAELKEENVIFAMEEPEIALAPHTQRRIATYLLTKTTQCFVTSHSPYVIESFTPEQIVILRRDDNAIVTGKRVILGPDMKAKTYRRYIRRGFAEAMLGRGVIVAEGITEQLALQTVAEKVEAADSSKYPIDLSGVTIITTDGDGSIPEFGRFFVSLDLPTFAFFDNKTRTPKDRDALNQAGFQVLNEIPYAGMEDLLAAEVPLDHQWTYLENIRDSGLAPGVGIPLAHPANDKIQLLTRQVLKDGKGWGRAADLLELCTVGELPSTIVGFLDKIYMQFPRPKTPDIEPAGTQAESVETATAVEVADTIPSEGQ